MQCNMFNKHYQQLNNLLDESHREEFADLWKSIRSCYSDPASRYELTLKWLHNRILELDLPLSLIAVSHKTYEYYFDMVTYLMREVSEGFQPRWMFTYRYINPDDKTRPLLMNANPNGTLNTQPPSKKNLERYEYSFPTDSKYDKWCKHRYSDIDEIYLDTHHVNKRILRQIYRFRGIDTSRRTRPNIYYFHEKGSRKNDKDKLFHTHALLPATSNLRYTSKVDLEDYFNNRRSPFRSLSCLSHQKIKVDEITNVRGILSYLSKENSLSHVALDPHNSHTIQSKQWKQQQAQQQQQNQDNVWQ